jgi:hypothetical protein
MEPPGVSLPPSSASSFVRRALVAASIALVAACQAPAASKAPTPAPSEPGQGSPAATAQPSGSPPGLFRVVGTAPVVPRSTFPDRNAVLPGAVMVDADGTYHAWVITFAREPGTQDVHHLTSADGVDWTEVADASLVSLSEGFGNPGAIPASVLRDGDGWAMYLVGTLATERQGWDIWRATAPAASGPWTRGEEPVLRRGAAGAWDAGALDFPTVIATETGYSMFYSGIEATTSTGGRIGMASSEDGITWTKADAPVAQPGICGGFDDRAVQMPRVIATADKLVMAYAGFSGPIDAHATVGYADSLDGGDTWSCAWPYPALDTEGLPDGGFVHTLTAFRRGDRMALLIEWFADGSTDDWLADMGVGAP